MSNPLLDLIVRGESGADGYNAYNRGTYVDLHGGKHIRGPSGAIDFSSLTVGQVHDLQHLRGDDPHRVFAVGRYQVIPSTMDGAITKLNLDRDLPFSTALQDRIFSEYLIVDKRPAIHGYVTGQPGITLEAAQRSLAAEWASFGDPDQGGASHYGGANHASITLAQSASALNQMRTTYQADIACGFSPSEAWKHVTASDHQRSSSDDESPSNHLRRQGNHGDAVRTLQSTLAALGYCDAHGRSLKSDGDFGSNTHSAVVAFQREHHLAVDGKVGPRTQHALDLALRQKDRVATTWLDDLRHPDHALYQQALAGVHRIDAQLGRHSDTRSENLAAAIVVAARRQGLGRIDQVVLCEDGERAFVLQNGLPARMAHVQTADAVHTSIMDSSVAWTQANQQAACRSVSAQAQAVPVSPVPQAIGR